MAKKSSKGEQSAPVHPKKGVSPLVVGAVLVAVIAVGLLAFWRPSEPGAPAAAAAASSAADTSGSAQKFPEPDAAVIAKVEAMAKLGPHKQAMLPPVPFQGYAPPRPHDVITAAYQFAAEHPEILGYVPCFCGCEHSGHTGNADCFVRSRAENGDVLEWDEHGVECTICIDVATRSRQMHASGASARDIRAAIEKTYGPQASTRTPTPQPPAQDR